MPRADKLWGYVQILRGFKDYMLLQDGCDSIQQFRLQFLHKIRRLHHLELLVVEECHLVRRTFAKKLFWVVGVRLLGEWPIDYGGLLQLPQLQYSMMKVECSRDNAESFLKQYYSYEELEPSWRTIRSLKAHKITCQSLLKSGTECSPEASIWVDFMLQIIEA